MMTQVSKQIRQTLAIAAAGVLTPGLVACDQKPSAEKAWSACSARRLPTPAANVQHNLRHPSKA